jgi:hypothetical protein
MAPLYGRDSLETESSDKIGGKTDVSLASANLREGVRQSHANVVEGASTRSLARRSRLTISETRGNKKGEGIVVDLTGLYRRPQTQNLAH